MPPTTTEPHAGRRSRKWWLSLSLTVMLTVAVTGALAACVLSAGRNIGREDLAARELAGVVLASAPRFAGLPLVPPGARSRADLMRLAIEYGVGDSPAG